MNDYRQMTLDIEPSGQSVLAFESAENLINTMDSYNFEDLFESKLPYEEMHNGNSMAILGDSLEVLKSMKSNSVTLIFADAPYNIGKDFGNNKDKWDSVHEYIEWCKL